MRNRDCAFLTGYATVTFNQHSAYTGLPVVTTHANALRVLRGYWTKVHQICSRNIFSLPVLTP